MKKLTQSVNKVVTTVSTIIVLQGCTYNCPYPPPVTSAKPETRPVAVLASYNPGMPIGSAPREPAPPAEVIAGTPHFPGQESANPGSMAGMPSASGRQKYEKSPFGANFWAYLAASAVIKCIPDCFK